MLGHAHHHQRARRHFDGFAIVLALQHVVAEQGVQNFRMGQQRVGWLAVTRQPVAGFQRQLERVAGGFQAVGLLIGQLIEFFRLLAQCAGGFLLLQAGGDLFFDGGKVRLLDIVQTQDVITKVGFHHAAHLALGQFERGVFKRLDHHALGKIAQIAALGGRARVLRARARQFGKTARIGFQLFQQRFGLLARLGARSGVGILAGGNQDMRHPALLRRQFGTVLFEILADFFVADLDAGGQLVLAEHHILGAHHVWCLIAFALRVVIGFHRLVVNFDLSGKLLRAQHPGADLARLANQLVDALNAGVGHQRRAGDAVQLFLNQQIVANHFLKVRRRQALALQEQLILGFAELAVFLQAGDVQNRPPQFIGADHQARRPGVRQQQLFTHQVFQHALTGSGVGRAAVERALDILLVDLDAIHLGQIGVIGSGGITAYTKTDKGQRHAAEHNFDEQGVFLDKIEHGTQPSNEATIKKR